MNNPFWTKTVRTKIKPEIELDRYGGIAFVEIASAWPGRHCHRGFLQVVLPGFHNTQALRNKKNI